MPTGTASVAHVGGGDNPRFAGDQPLVCTYGERTTPRNTIIDWDAGRRNEEQHTEQPQTVRCRDCRQRTVPEDLADGMCSLCRSTAESRFDNAPPAAVEADEPVEDLVEDFDPDDVDGLSDDPDHQPADFHDDGTDCDEGTTCSPDADCAHQDGTTSPQPAVVPAWGRLLDDTANHPQAAVQVLRSAILTNLAALHLLVDPPEHEQTSQPAEPHRQDRLAAAPECEAPPARFETFERPHKSRRSSVDTAEIVRRYNNGQTIPQIAQEMSHSRNTVRTHLLNARVQLRDDRKTHSGSSPKDYDPQLVDEIRRLYVDEQLAQDEVAAKVGIGAHVVQRLMKRHGIPTRRPVARTPGDHSVSLKQRITALGVTSRDIKTWALDQGLIDQIKRGIPAASLVDAYAAAHGGDAE